MQEVENIIFRKFKMAKSNASGFRGTKGLTMKTIMRCSTMSEEYEDEYCFSSSIEENFLAAYVPVDPRGVAALAHTVDTSPKSEKEEIRRTLSMLGHLRLLMTRLRPSRRSAVKAKKGSRSGVVSSIRKFFGRQKKEIIEYEAAGLNGKYSIYVTIY